MIKASNALLVIVAFLTVASFSSCKKGKKTDTEPVVKGTVTADIDGKASDFSKFALSYTGSVNGKDFTAVQGDSDDGSTIGLTVFGTITVGKTYTGADQAIGTGPTLLYSVGDDDYLTDLYDPSVTITVTAVSSSSIKGTFSGSVTNIASGANHGKKMVITNGKFNVQR